jgi:Amt family ammonium transporter
MACLLGLLGGALVVFSIVALDKVKIDDPVGAISVHGVCGALGIMLVPLTNGDASFVNQLIGLVCILAFVFVASFIVWTVLNKTMGIRVTEEEELNGMDQHDCGIEAYPEFVSVRNS